MHEQIQTLIDDHGRIRRLLNAFEDQLVQFAEAGQPDYDMLEFGVDACAEYLDALHHRKEELLLVRLYERMPESAEQMDGLTRQHRGLEKAAHDVAAAFSAVRDGTMQARAPLVAAGRLFLHGYRHHLKWEEARFFPTALEALSESDWRDLAAEWAREADCTEQVRHSIAIFDVIAETE